MGTESAAATDRTVRLDTLPSQRHESPVWREVRCFRDWTPLRYHQYYRVGRDVDLRTQVGQRVGIYVTEVPWKKDDGSGENDRGNEDFEDLVRDFGSAWADVHAPG